jgi:hypothetical protein
MFKNKLFTILLYLYLQKTVEPQKFFAPPLLELFLDPGSWINIQGPQNCVPIY